MDIITAKAAIDKIIRKSRVHLYKPIQIAEILYRDRVYRDIDLSKLETYRNPSKQWRDEICMKFLGRTSSSSAKYQDDVFSKTAVPPDKLVELGKANKANPGIVESYIYKHFNNRFSQLSGALSYSKTHDKSNFNIEEFLNLFWQEAGLKRSIDKIYEIIVFALFSAIVDSIDLKINVSYNPEKSPILKEFEDFAQKVIQLNSEITNFTTEAKLYRVGVTNASDRGLDMWGNFGLAIQIKHLSLNEKLASEIVNSISADRIVIVCKKAESNIILSLLTQIGWKSRIQSIVTEDDLIQWYEKAMIGKFSHILGEKIIDIISNEIETEFPATKAQEFKKFYNNRKYQTLNDEFWEI
jgi:type II restriction enzyme